MRRNPYYYSVYIIGLNFVINAIVPFVSIVILNILLYRQLKLIVKSRSFQSATPAISPLQSIKSDIEKTPRFSTTSIRRLSLSEVMLAKFSLFIILVLIICHSIKWIPNVYELVERIQGADENVNWPLWIQSVSQISHFLTVLNSSVNFYVYLMTHYGLSCVICLGE